MSNDISYISRSAAYSSGADTVQPIVPGSVSNGNMLLAFVEGLSNVDITSSGWEFIGRGGNNHFALFAKYYAGESGPYTFTQSSSTFMRANVVAYSGNFPASITDLVHVLSNTDYGTAGTAVVAASMVTTETDLDIIWIAGSWLFTPTTYTPPTVPGSFSEDFEDGDTTSGFWLSFARYTWSSSGSTGDMIGYLSNSVSNNKHAFAIALNPPSGVVNGMMSIGF